MNDQILNISIEARIAKLERDLRRGSSVLNRNVGGMERRAKLASQRIERHFAAIGAGMMAGVTSAVSMRAAQQLIDTSTRIGNSLWVAGLAGEDLEKVYRSLFESAQRNAAPLESLAQLYSRVSLVQGELGASTEDMLKFTDNVAVALRVAGTDAQSASGALLQLSQAMGSGVVRAEEFNSILEGALPIAQAVAAGLDEAGGSVSKLRTLVVDGKVSSAAFFDAFEAGSVTLQHKVAAAEMSVSSSFVRLQNVLIDAAGRFNETSSAGQRFASFLDTLGSKITGLVNSPSFDSALNDLGDAMAKTFEADMRDIQTVIELVEGLAAKFDSFGASVTDAQLELAQAEQAMSNLATNTKGRFGELDAAFQDLVQQLLEGRGTAEMAAEAITALGDANPDFSSLQGQISAVIQNFIALREAARAALQPDVAGLPMTYAGQEGAPPPKPATPVERVTLADYPVAPVAGGGSGGGGRASAVRAEADAAAELIAELENELRLIGLSEVEKRIDTELRRAGSSATEAQKLSIRGLVTEIEAQNEALERTQAAMEGAKGLVKDFLGGLLSDLRSGVDGANALANAFGRLADRLLDMALDTVINSLFAGMMGGGGGLLGGLFGFSQGGIVEAAAGGLIRGPGSGTSDSIPARLSDGEFVVRASQTAKHLDVLRAINDGKVAAFATGGLVGDGPAIRAANDNIGSVHGNATPTNVTITSNVTVNTTGGKPEQNDDLARQTAKHVENQVRAAVHEEIRAATRPGGYLRRA
ncbi:phage tape measure protein [Devosia pacifica]|uniref:Phage tape measure protein n=1 Tax=Devosia pacifica TaxID=1335967 RepID=A0A918VXS4_9HYPH|nr:tape measure protein [Devosia pacifica]GHA35012.1 phage tape measure protein [Devosia pacifica]